MRAVTRRVPIVAALVSCVAFPAYAQQSRHGLPPVPLVHGALHLTVAYPAPNARVASRDSIFLFGTVGNGNAHLMIAGQAVAVAPNGAWIAWIATPPDSAFVLRIGARLGADTTTTLLPLVHEGWVRRAGAWVDGASLSPIGDIRLAPGLRQLLSVRAASGASVRLLVPGHAPIIFVPDSVPAPVPEATRDFDLNDRNLTHPQDGDEYVGSVPADVGGPVASLFSPAPTVSASPVLEVTLRGVTARMPWPIAIYRLSGPPSVIELQHHAATGVLRDASVVGRASPSGTYAWFFPPGTRAMANGRVGDAIRLQLDHDDVAWVSANDVRWLSLAPEMPPAVMGSLTLHADSAYSSVRIPLSWPVPMRIDDGDRQLVITLFGAVSDANWTRYGAGQEFVRTLTWRQASEDRVVLTATFDRSLWGWRTRVDGTDLVIDMRPPPPIAAGRPLLGRHIVVDAGHPPGGACGPTGLCEPEANLAIARLVRDALVAGGAVVTMTRPDSVAVALDARPALADSVGADVLVSIHNNAFPDGVNPFANNGSTTFFNHVASIPLAREVQRHLTANLGLRDLGVARGDLALVRPTWYPAILVEGLYLMFPDQEAALRSRAGQELYASAVVDGITGFLRSAAAPPR